MRTPAEGRDDGHAKGTTASDGGYFDADSAEPTAACPAASRAVSTRKGEQLT
jgi:hypothetical protein